MSYQTITNENAVFLDALNKGTITQAQYDQAMTFQNQRLQNLGYSSVATKENVLVGPLPPGETTRPTIYTQTQPQQQPAPAIVQPPPAPAPKFDSPMPTSFWNPVGADAYREVVAAIPPNAQNVEIKETTQPIVGPLPPGQFTRPTEKVIQATYTLPPAPTSEPEAPKSLSDQILDAGKAFEEALPGGVLGLVGLGRKPDAISVVPPSINQKNPLAAAAGVVAAGENIIYSTPRVIVKAADYASDTFLKAPTAAIETVLGGSNMGGLTKAGLSGPAQGVINRAVPQPPATVTSALGGTLIDSASKGRFSPSDDAAKLMERGPEYAIGTIAGDLLISAGIGKALDLTKGTSATKITSITEIERARQIAPDEYVTTRLTNVNTNKVPISRADAVRFAELEKMSTPKDINLGGLEKVIQKGGGETDLFMRATETTRSATPVIEAVKSKGNTLTQITGLSADKIKTPTSTVQEVVSNTVLAGKVKGAPKIYSEAVVKVGDDIIAPTTKLTERSFTGVEIVREMDTPIYGDITKELKLYKDIGGPAKFGSAEIAKQTAAKGTKTITSITSDGFKSIKVNVSPTTPFPKVGGVSSGGGTVAETVTKAVAKQTVSTDIISVTLPKSGFESAAAKIGSSLVSNVGRTATNVAKSESRTVSAAIPVLQPKPITFRPPQLTQISEPTQAYMQPTVESVMQTSRAQAPITFRPLRMADFAESQTVEASITELETSTRKSLQPEAPIISVAQEPDRFMQTPRYPAAPVFEAPKQSTKNPTVEMPITFEMPRERSKTTMFNTPTQKQRDISSISFKSPVMEKTKTAEKTVLDTATTPRFTVKTATFNTPGFTRQKTPTFPNFPRGGGSGGNSLTGSMAGSWKKPKNPVKTYDAMLKTFGVSTGKTPQLSTKGFKQPNINFGGNKKRKSRKR